MPRSQRLIVLVLTTALIASACQPAATPTTQAPETTTPPQPTAEPTTTEEPAVTPSPTPCPTPTPASPISDPPINGQKTVTLALPSLALSDACANAVILQVTPLLEPPTATVEQLRNDPDGVIIGFLRAERALPLSDPQVPKLPADSYWVWVRQGLMSFINSQGQELRTSLQADLRTIEMRERPEALISVKDICYAWLQVQVCTEPSPRRALSQNESDAIQGMMREGVEALGLTEVISVTGTIPDMVATDIEELQFANALAAPTVKFPSDQGDVPVDGALLGVFYALEDIDIDESHIPLGPYAVKAHLEGERWSGIFSPVEGDPLPPIPARYFEARGQTKELDGEPLAMLFGIRIILCWFSSNDC